MLYWAYGSNLNRAAMAERCPGARMVGPLTIKGGALVFRGVADVILRDDSAIPGGVWEINQEDERELDLYEGVRSGLYRKLYLRLAVDGRERRCLYYAMSPDRYGIAPPSEPYLETIMEGYRDFGLPMERLEAAVMESWEDKRLTPRIARHRRRRGGKVARVEKYFPLDA